MTADLPLATAALRWAVGRMPAEDLVDGCH